MFTDCIPILILTRVVVFGFSVDKLSSDDLLEFFEVSAFVFDNDSIRLNITWDDNFSNTILDIFVENNDVDSECFYPYEDTYDLNEHNAFIPSLKISNPVDELLLGCTYIINVTLEKLPLSYVYQVPDCIGNYCTCITNETNLIKLVKVDYIAEHVFKVEYSSYNTSLEKGNFYLTEVFYVKENSANYFQVPEVKYAKGEFEIVMEYINEGENYTVFVNYRDSNNANPQCEYTSSTTFKAQVKPTIRENYLLLKIVFAILLFLFSSLILYGFLRWSRYSTKTVERLKKIIFPSHDDPQIIKNLKTSSLRCLHQEINALYTPLEISEAKNRPINLDPYEFPRENIIMKDVIGEGAFGKVYYAKAYKLNGIPGFTMVAVKQLRGDAPKEELAGFQDEIKMLKKIGVHKNIVKLLACVTKTQPYMIVMELVSTGDLKVYLLKLREIWIKNRNKRRFFPDDMEEKLRNVKEELTNEKPNNNSTANILPKAALQPTPGAVPSKQALSEGITSFDADTKTPLLSDIGGCPDPVLDHQELENFALQIATGMAYLEQIPITHRDLAARNILITKDKTLKISDFGMSRTGPYVNRHLKKMPLRWMAIESVEEFKNDNKSDVWSFGVVLWEIGTLGAFPYEKIPNELLIKALKTGHRLPRPEICTDELYVLMKKCWMGNPKDRPSFSEIVEHLKVKKEHVYVDFSKVNPKYVFPPTDPKT